VHTCEICSARVNELRRGRCWGCYSRWVDARPVGAGAKCLTCGERRRRMLKSVELFGGWPAMCFSCAGQLASIDPLPQTVLELRQVLSRERRGPDRRLGRSDTRVFQYERRVGDRRMSRDGTDLIDDDMIVEIIVEDDAAGLDFDDQTQIRDLIQL
jgi:hypothetical protein